MKDIVYLIDSNGGIEGWGGGNVHPIPSRMFYMTTSSKYIPIV